MPEASMDEDHQAMLRKHDVWLAGQARAVQPVPETVTVQKASQQTFGLRVGASNAGHHAAADFLGDSVYHRISG